MSHNWADLQKLSDEELIAEHDKVAEQTVVGINYYRDELLHRRMMRSAQAQWEQADAVRQLTERLIVLTRLIGWLTAGAVLASLGSVVVSALSR